MNETTRSVSIGRTANTIGADAYKVLLYPAVPGSAEVFGKTYVLIFPIAGVFVINSTAILFVFTL